MNLKTLLLCGLFIIPAFAQTDSTMTFEEYDPPSTLVVPEHEVTKAKFPFIDVHNHQWDYSKGYLDTLIQEMDKLNMTLMVNLSGRGFRRTADGGFGLREPEFMQGGLTTVKENFNDRIIFFTNVDFSGIDKPGWAEKTLAELEADVKAGAKGLKIYKSLGMNIKDSKSNRVAVDDERIDPVWAKCGELGIPV